MSTGPVELQGITINAGILETLQGFSTNRNVLKGITIAVGTGAQIMQLKVVDRNHEPIEGATCRVLNAISWSNNVLSFDGVDDYVQANNPITSYPFTIEVLAKRVAQKDQSLLILAPNGGTSVQYGININGSNKAEIIARNTTSYRTASSITIGTNDYYRISGVFETNTSRKLYVNGELEGTQTNSVTFNVGTNVVLFGLLRNASPTWFFGGFLSDARLWNKARSQVEIQTDMHKRLAGDETNLAEYWKLDEGTGILVNGLTNNGTILGAQWQEAGEDFPLYGPTGLQYTDPYDSQTTNANGLCVLNYQINTLHGLEVTLPGKRRFIMPFERTTRGLLDWQVMLSDYLATFATDRGNILINSEPENNDANFLIE